MAEVLITLGIIGVVAAMTLPALIQKHKEIQTTTALKKNYSILQQAFLMAENDKGPFDCTTASPKSFYEYFTPYLKLQKDCKTSKGCWANKTIKFLDGSDWVNLNDIQYYYKAILYDGTSLQAYAMASSTHYGEIRLDINGFKGPNTIGKDIFAFDNQCINGKTKIIPEGIQGTSAEFPILCKYKTKSPIDYNGTSCTAWVIYTGNMDYLHCDDLSWNGKTKCK